MGINQKSQFFIQNTGEIISYILIFLTVGVVISLIAGFSTVYPILAIVLSLSIFTLLFFILRPNLPYYLLIILLHTPNIFLETKGKIFIYTLAELFAIIVFSLWAFSRVINLTKPYPRTPCDIPVMLFFGLALMSLLFTTDYRFGIFQLEKLFLSLGIFGITVLTVNNHKTLDTIIWFIFGMGIFNSIFCFLSIYSYPDYTTTTLLNYNQFNIRIIFNDLTVTKRGHSFAHPLTTALWLNFAIIFSFGKFYAARGKKKALLGILTFFMLTAQLTTLSKGPLLALVVGIIFFFYITKPIRKFFFTSVAVLAILVSVAFLLSNITEIKRAVVFTTHQLTPSGEGETSTHTRLSWWKTAIIKNVETFGLGVGAGELPRYLKPHAPHPHSVYMSAFGELGFIGFGLLMLIFYSSFKNYSVVLKQCTSDYYKCVLSSYISGFVMLMFFIISDYDYTTNIIWWYLGFGFAISKLAKETPSEYGYVYENLPAAIKGNSPA